MTGETFDVILNAWTFILILHHKLTLKFDNYLRHAFISDSMLLEKNLFTSISAVSRFRAIFMEKYLCEKFHRVTSISHQCLRWSSFNDVRKVLARWEEKSMLFASFSLADQTMTFSAYIYRLVSMPLRASIEQDSDAERRNFRLQNLKIESELLRRRQKHHRQRDKNKYLQLTIHISSAHQNLSPVLSSLCCHLFIS